MTSDGHGSGVGWWAKGLLFENCSCQVVCPGHVHFDQLCTYEHCLGWWAVRIDEGSFGDVALDGVKGLVAFDSPQRMVDGDWIQTIVIDEGADEDQRAALEKILLGEVGGPWEVLARFVGRRLDTLYAPILIEDEPDAKRIAIDGLLEGSIAPIRGRDRSEPVRFENIFNQIHAPSQVIARGGSRYDDGVLSFENEDSHGLWSSFDWSDGGT